MYGMKSRRLGTAVVALLLPLLASCGDSVTGVGFDSLVSDGVSYRVSGLVVAESFPVQIGVTVEVKNESSASRTVVFPDGCVVLMRVYRDGNEPVWDMAQDRACTEALVEVVLGSGQTKELQTGLVSAGTILGDSLPNGEYRITGIIRPGGEVLELVAGSVGLAKP